MVVDLVISCPRGQVRGETINLSLSLLEGSKGGLWCQVQECLAEDKDGAGNFGLKSG